MNYLTQLIGKRVVDEAGEPFGKLVEVVVTPGDPLPVVAAFQVRTSDGAMFVPAEALDLPPGAKELPLNRPVTRVQPYQIREEDFSLVRDVLDKQIVDIHDYRVVRVNDVRLELMRDGRLALMGVDAGAAGILRRLGLEGAVTGLGRLLHLAPAGAPLIPWSDVEAFPVHNAGDPLRLRIPYEKLSKLHPADIGDILNQLDPAQRREVLETLDVETAAEALAEADEDVQVHALQHLDEERAADILEEMPADEAADVLGDMDRGHREDLLGRMEAEWREDVEDLLPYGDKTAGGLMTTEYVAIPRDYSAQRTIEALRELEPEAETIYYVYVVDKEERLVGVISLRDLIVARPEAVIADFMITKTRSVPLDATIAEVAHTFERYKLLALPVVDSEKRLQGIITIDDTLEQLLPPDWRRRPGQRRPKGQVPPPEEGGLSLTR
jgi:magnesium transporter